MKSIEFLIESEKLMRKINIPANIKIGTLELNATGSLTNWAGKNGDFVDCVVNFECVFLTTHIQHLLDIGVEIIWNTVRTDNSTNVKATKHAEGREAIKMRRYQTYINQRTGFNSGLAENWLRASARCSIHTLVTLDKYVRDNHRGEIAIHNDFQTGWKKEKYVKRIDFSDTLKYVKNIRRNASLKHKKYADMQPIERRAMYRDNVLYI
jgi:hypothetical protein